MAEIEGFWSYVHNDDESEGGRIARLARDVSSQFEMITGDKISLFLDRDALAWGEEWRNKIDLAIKRNLSQDLYFHISAVSRSQRASSCCLF